MAEITILAKTGKIEGLETWLPARNSAMHLCEQQTGPFVRIEEYRALREKYDALLKSCTNPQISVRVPLPYGGFARVPRKSPKNGGVL